MQFALTCKDDSTMATLASCRLSDGTHYWSSIQVFVSILLIETATRTKAHLQKLTMCLGKSESFGAINFSSALFYGPLSYLNSGVKSLSVISPLLENIIGFHGLKKQKNQHFGVVSN